MKKASTEIFSLLWQEGYADGTIIECCAIFYEPTSNIANLEGGRVFLDGLIYEVEAATLNARRIQNHHDH